MSVPGPGGTTITVEFSPTTAPLATPTWVDISAYVRRDTFIEVRRGRSNELDEFQAGTARFQLFNDDRRFDPFHASGPYFGNLKPLRRFRIRVVRGGSTFSFVGFNLDWRQEYDRSNRMAYVPIELVDGFEFLQNAALPGSALEYELLVDNPLGYWLLDETSGTDARDLSANDFDGTYVAGTTSLSDVRSPSDQADHRGLVLDGNHAAHVDEKGAALLGGGPFTVEALVAPSAAGMLYRSGEGVATSGVRVEITTSGSTWRMEAADQTDAINTRRSFFHEISDTPVWLTFRRDGLGIPHAYINGVSDNASITSVTPATAAEPGVWVGTEKRVGESQQNGFVGFVAHVVSYNSDIGTTRIAAHAAAALTPWDGDSTGTRIGRILDAIGWPAGDRVIDTGQTTLGPARLSGSPLSYAKSVAEIEQGQLFMDGQGRVVFQNRYHRLNSTTSTTSQAAFGGDGASGELPYRAGGVSITRARDHIVNDVVFDNSAGGSVNVKDSASQADFGVREERRTVAATATVAQLRDAAAYLLDRYKDPQDRIPAITFSPTKTPESGETWTATQMWTAALGLDISNRVTVKRRPQGVGSAISLSLLIEGVTHRFNNIEYDVTLQLSPADTRTYFTWDTSTWDTSTRWAY